MTEFQDQTLINKIAQMQEGPVSAHVEAVMHETQQADLAPDERAGVLADHLAGAALRTGEDAEQTQLMLRAVSTLAGSEKWQGKFTRQNGLRRTLVHLDTDTDGKVALGTVGHRLTNDAEGRVLMTSLDQLAGYVSPKTEQEAQAVSGLDKAVPWKDELIREFTDYVAIPGRKEAWKAADNLGSEVSSVKESQQQWERAQEIAKRAGLDVDLLTRSAEFIKKHAEISGKKVGGLALRAVAPENQYDHLFE